MIHGVGISISTETSGISSEPNAIGLRFRRRLSSGSRRFLFVGFPLWIAEGVSLFPDGFDHDFDGSFRKTKGFVANQLV